MGENASTGGHDRLFIATDLIGVYFSDGGMQLYDRQKQQPVWTITV